MSKLKDFNANKDKCKYQKNLLVKMMVHFITVQTHKYIASPKPYAAFNQLHNTIKSEHFSRHHYQIFHPLSAAQVTCYRRSGVIMLDITHSHLTLLHQQHIIKHRYQFYTTAQHVNVNTQLAYHIIKIISQKWLPCVIHHPLAKKYNGRIQF